MRWMDYLCISVKNVFRSGFKSLLAVFAIAVGIASLSIISCLSNSGIQVVEHELDSLGIDGLTMYIQKRTSEDIVMNPEYAQTIENNIRTVQCAMPFSYQYGSIRKNTHTISAMIWGVGDNLCETLDLDLLYGRAPNRFDLGNQLNVAVIDDRLADQIFKRIDVVGENVELNIKGTFSEFTIIGVISSQKNMLDQVFGTAIPEFVYTPYTTLSAHSGRHAVDQIAIRCFAQSDDEMTAEAILNLMKHVDQTGTVYDIENINGYISGFKGVIRSVFLIIGAIGAISLLVAGIGVISTMLSSMAERRRDIGLYMALGATGKTILVSVLLETIILCLVGTLLGLAAGNLGGYAIVKILGFPYVAQFHNYMISMLFSVLLGILCGVFPAINAAKMTPLETMRNER